MPWLLKGNSRSTFWVNININLPKIVFKTQEQGWAQGPCIQAEFSREGRKQLLETQQFLAGLSGERRDLDTNHNHRECNKSIGGNTTT